MSGFSIDDVRETFTADITNFLGRIEEAARALLASPALEANSLRDIGGTFLFEKVGDFAHAITGTSSLVSANSLAESARMIEHLGGKGLEEVRLVEAHAKEARRIAQHCAEGAAEMRAMLDLELKHDSDEAEWLLLAFRDKLADILGHAVTGTGAEKVESPAFDAEVRASLAASATPAANEVTFDGLGSSPSQSPAFDEELQVIFREEVRESGEALARHVQSFIDDSDKMVSAGHIERILHGIKGGAGAAGFPSVHKLSEELRRAFEGVIIGSVQVTSAFVKSSIGDLDRLLEMAGAPRLPVSFKPEASDDEIAVELPSEDLEMVSEGDDLDTMFHDEARDLLVPLQGYLQKMLENPSDDASAKSVERIFHTLKGSASFAGLSNVSDAAGELQARMAGVIEQTTPVTAGFLDQIARDTNRILRQVNLPEIAIAAGRGADAEFSFAEEDIGPPHSRAMGPEPIHAELHAEFLASAREALSPVQSFITALATDSTDLSAARKLEKIFEQVNAIAQRNDLPQLAGMCADLAKMMRDVADARIDAGEDTLAAFALESNAVLRKVDVKPITLSPPPMPGDSFQSGAEGAEFSFAEEHSAAEDVAEVDKELQAIFQEEARELVIALQGHLQGLVSDPTNIASADHVERIFHTLKGAAATVGLKEVSKIAESLQKRMEDVLESGTEVDEPFLKGLLDDTRKLLRLANLPELVLASGAGNKEAPSGAEPHSEVADAHKYFMEEARELCEKAGQYLDELTKASEPKAREIRGELGKLFHRLKGSALVVAEDAIATEAARLQSLASADKTSAAVLQRGLARVTQLLQSDKADEPSFQSAAARKPAKPPRVKEAVVRERVQLPAEPDLVEAFNQECSELLDQTDRAILALEETSQPKAALETLMRLTHTLKGAVNTIGLGPTGAILHRVESFLEGLLEATILPSMKAVATFLLEVQQEVRRNLRTSADGYVETSVARVESRIGNVLAGSKATYEPVSHTGGSSVSIINVDTGGGSGDAESLQAGQPADAADRRFIRVSTERLDALMNLAGELVVSRSRLMSRIEILKQLQQELGRSRRRLMDTVESFREEHEFTYRRPGEMHDAYQATIAQMAGRADANAAATSNRSMTKTKKSDDMTGFSDAEMDRYDDVNVLARSLAEMSNDFNEMYGQLYRELTAFAADSEAHGSIVTGIQSEVTRARMVPLEFLFQRLRLPVRDAAAREGKEVRVVTSGEDVNIDKTIADALFGPMLHLVRNAVVHGVESPAARQAGGKKEVGTLTLAARQESGQIVIEVRDDGNGLDLAALHAKGVAMGIITPETSVQDQNVKDLVFAAGLSTRTTVGNVAGRGVGGNVVRRAVDRLNGSIRVDTIPGKGTAFLVTLPLTLAITKALLVSNRGRSYAIPLYFAQHILDAEDGIIVESAGVRRVRLDDTYVTVLTMDELFGTPERPESKMGPVLVLRVGDQRLMLQVDTVLGQEEVVVKSLGDLLTGHPVLAGVTIRGTGELALILDIPGVVEAHSVRAVSGGGPKITAALERGTKQRETVARIAAVQRKLRVLFVDDSLSVRKIAEKELTNLGTDVTTAVDGLDAMAKLREGNFDMIFTDLEMPRMHGYDLIRELRFLPAYQDLPIIVVSSRSGQKHQDQARALGCTDYLTKPFNARQLEGALDKYGGRKQKQLAAAQAAAAADDSQNPSQDSGGEST